MQVKLCLIVCDYPECADLCWFAAGDAVPYKVCSACKYTHYCSRSCQSNHWREHKASCSAQQNHIYGEVIRQQMERKFEPVNDVMYELLKHPIFSPMQEFPAIPFKTMVDMTLSANSPNTPMVKKYKNMLTTLRDKIKTLGITRGYVISIRGLQMLVYS